MTPDRLSPHADPIPAQDSQLELFGAAVETILSPFCIYEHGYASSKCRRGRAVLGPIEGDAECENRSLCCLGCGCTGVQSRTQDCE